MRSGYANGARECAARFAAALAGEAWGQTGAVSSIIEVCIGPSREFFSHHA
jgi:hypothetical protein